MGPRNWRTPNPLDMGPHNWRTPNPLDMGPRNWRTPNPLDRDRMLALEGLSARYGRVTALSDVSLTVAAAEFVCLIGANGAGKTTTLKAISGLVRAAAGRIRFDGQEIQNRPPQ